MQKAVCSLLVHVDASDVSPIRERAAVALARDHGAHVRALYSIGELYVPGWADWPPHVLDEHREQEEARAQRVLARFRETAASAGVDHDTETAHLGAESAGQVLALRGRYFDAVMVGQPDPDDATAADGHALIEHLVLGAGRPVWLMPYIGVPQDAQGRPRIGRRVTVGWDGGREAARAVHDALGILGAAEAVDLVTIDPERQGGGDDGAYGDALARHLARHGIEASMHGVDSHGMRQGDVLLNHVVDSASDTLVIGAYGHSRLREVILGGVTRAVLERTSVPVLMSH